jgi:hypothetical protein
MNNPTSKDAAYGGPSEVRTWPTRTEGSAQASGSWQSADLPAQLTPGAAIRAAALADPPFIADM